MKPLGPVPLSLNGTLRWGVVGPILEELSPARVLEVGCGQGGFGARIAQRADYVGVEPDETSYRVAARRIEPLGGKVLQCSVEQVPAEARFDLVCAFEVIEHLENDQDALAAWAGRLRDGGALLVSVPAWPERFGPYDELVGHYRRYRPDDLDDLLRKVGCVDIQHVLYGWPLGSILLAALNVLARRRRADLEQSMGARTAASGRRFFQPDNRMVGRAIQLATTPFAALQRLRPAVGPGLVALGQLP